MPAWRYETNWPIDTRIIFIVPATLSVVKTCWKWSSKIICEVLQAISIVKIRVDLSLLDFKEPKLNTHVTFDSCCTVNYPTYTGIIDVTPLLDDIPLKIGAPIIKSCCSNIRSHGWVAKSISTLVVFVQKLTHL